MNSVVKIVKTLRNHWKKSTCAAIALSYAYGFTVEHFEIQKLMRTYCVRASKYGKQTISMNANPKTITVILNPSANKRKAVDDFEKYCAPILHLAGISVDIIKTEYEGHAKTLIDELQNTDAIVVAGGDGTLCEVLTGLLRRIEENTNGLVPLGVLPLGRVNSVAKTLIPKSGHLEKVQNLADATMAIIEETVKPIDVLKIEATEDDNKPIYAASGVKWGAYRDAEEKKDKYWYWGGFRKYATYIFNGYKNSLTWNCEAEIEYTPPCDGCSNCRTVKSVNNQRWYQRFVGAVPRNDFTTIFNEQCRQLNRKNVSTIDFVVNSSNILPDNQLSRLQLNIGPKTIDYVDFVMEGCRYENEGERKIEETIDARTIDIKPKTQRESWFSIDNENYEIKPIRITLMPKIVNVFCSKNCLN